MKKTLAVLALTLTFASTSFAASSSLAELNLKIHSVITFKKLNKQDVYEKLNEVSEVSTAVTANNQIQHDLKKNVNTDKLIYSINNGLIRIQDEKSNIDTEVPVQVSKSILGRIKAFSITGDNLETVYFEALKNSGIIALKDLDLKKDERKSLVIGDQTCSVDRSSDVVVCEQDVELHVAQYKAILIGALYIFQLSL